MTSFVSFCFFPALFGCFFLLFFFFFFGVVFCLLFFVFFVCFLWFLDIPEVLPPGLLRR